MIKIHQRLTFGAYLLLTTLLLQESTLLADINLRIASYNIRREGKEKDENNLWEKRKNRVAELIQKVHPAVIGLQEATKRQIEDLKALLSGYDVVGEGRGASWGGLGANEANPIFYKKDAYELLDSGTFSINKVSFWTPLAYKSTGWLPRICTWVQLKDKKSKKIFYVYNTHLDNKYDLARQLGAKAIRAQMGDKQPIILTGDFNTVFENIKEVFNNFDHAADVTAKRSGPRETRTGWEDNELKAIDHILVQRGIRVPHYEVIVESKPYSSDHRLSYAEVEIK